MFEAENEKEMLDLKKVYNAFLEFISFFLSQ